MRISDCSSDVCSSDLHGRAPVAGGRTLAGKGGRVHAENRTDRRDRKSGHPSHGLGRRNPATLPSAFHRGLIPATRRTGAGDRLRIPTSPALPHRGCTAGTIVQPTAFIASRRTFKGAAFMINVHWLAQAFFAAFIALSYQKNGG